ncbi:hypothetical protein QCD70_17170 [Agreia sp. PsM10]|uniref:hypothetical protein n=1 Tax=Agreia sp. PsM10 TaxID=3030533 RepID=UPI00263B0F8E|nr:hypothetical protein [Agreia sp. PsM10]MDN4641980.1 hypothetical protein [Agreia sp. PsM10]
MGSLQIEDAPSNSDRTDFTNGPRVSQDLLISIPSTSTGPFSVLLCGNGFAEWRNGLNSADGWLRLSPSIGNQRVKGVYVFTAGLTAAEQTEILDALDSAASSFRDPKFGIIGGSVHVLEGLTAGTNRPSSSEEGLPGLKFRNIVVQKNSSSIPFQEAWNRTSFNDFN